MEKITFEQFRKAMFEFNKKNPNGHLQGVIVFTADSFNRPYTVKERSYRTANWCNGFNDRISNSIFGDCLDGTDLGVRLDWYMYDGWKVEYCYLENA